MSMSQHIKNGNRIFDRSQFSPSIIWVLVSELRSLGLVTRVLTHWVMSLVPLKHGIFLLGKACWPTSPRHPSWPYFIWGESFWMRCLTYRNISYKILFYAAKLGGICSATPSNQLEEVQVRLPLMWCQVHHSDLKSEKPLLWGWSPVTEDQEG